MKETYISFKESKWFPLIIGVLSVVLGIVCICNPKIQMESIALFAGIVFLAFGILQVVNGVKVKGNTALRVLYVLLGVVVIVLAIFAFINLELIGKYLPSLAGLFMIICAVSNLMSSVVILKSGIKSWWYGAVPAIILLVLGIVFLLKPGFVGQTFGIFAGISLLVNGVSYLVSYFQVK